MIPINEEELDALAGEYVLGVLEAAEAAEVAAALADNPQLLAAVTYWETRLDPLLDAVTPVAPPPGTWARIRARLTGPVIRPAGPDPAAFWQRSTIIVGAIAACLLVYVTLNPRPSTPSLVALLHDPSGAAPAWTATVGPRGLSLAAIGDHGVEAGKDLELWVIPPGAKVPVPLGLVPETGALALEGLPDGVRGGATLAISVEPKGGSPTGLPTGPIIYVGALVGLS
jgi:anti-sigma-K factor RskA